MVNDEADKQQIVSLLLDAAERALSADQLRASERMFDRMMPRQRQLPLRDHGPLPKVTIPSR